VRSPPMSDSPSRGCVCRSQAFAILACEIETTSCCERRSQHVIRQQYVYTWMFMSHLDSAVWRLVVYMTSHAP
jgi:hypothetical protein